MNSLSKQWNTLTLKGLKYYWLTNYQTKDSIENWISVMKTIFVWSQCLLRVFLWISDSDLEDLETPPRYRPDSLAALCRATRFTEAELKRIYRGFKAECPTGVVKEDAFKCIYSQFFPQGGIIWMTFYFLILNLIVCVTSEWLKKSFVKVNSFKMYCRNLVWVNSIRPCYQLFSRVINFVLCDNQNQFIK